MDQKQSVVIFKALADETRLSIVRKLVQCDQPTTSCDVVASCASFHKLSQPAMSHHFSKLVDAGVLKEEKIGTQKRYILDRELLDSIGLDPSKL